MQNRDAPTSVVRKTFSIPAALWQRIEDYQFQQRIKKDADVLRTLLEYALDCKAAGMDPKQRQKEKA